MVEHHPIVIETPACSSSPIVADTTTSMISSSPLPVTSSSSPPVASNYNHPTTPDESMECSTPPADVPIADDPSATTEPTSNEADESMESSSEIPTPTAAAADDVNTNANVNTSSTTIVNITTTTDVPTGWTREISAGSVIYIR